MRILKEYLTSRIENRDAEGDINFYKDPPMSINDAKTKIGKGLSDCHHKMADWHEGKRRENVKLCSDAKLIVYYNICIGMKYTEEAEKLEQEANRRGWTFNKTKK